MPDRPRPAPLTSAFSVAKPAWGWVSAVKSALGLGGPLLFGAAFGHESEVLMVMFGGFALDFTGDEPYARRSRVVLAVTLGLAASMAVGTLVATSVWLIALGLAAVGAVAAFACGAFGLVPPGPLLFVLICAIGTHLPIDQGAAAGRAGLVALGGLWALLVADVNVLWDRDGPQARSVADAYRTVAAFLEAVGTSGYDAARHAAGRQHRAAIQVTESAADRRRTREEARRLRELADAALPVFRTASVYAAESRGAYAPEAAAFLRALAAVIAGGGGRALPDVPEPPVRTAAADALHDALAEAVRVAAGGSSSWRRTPVPTPSIRQILASAAHRPSLVPLTTIRTVVTIGATTGLAYLAGGERPYWAPAAGVAAQRDTFRATLVRGMQRSGGTALGVVIGGGLLALRPSPWLIAVAIMALRFAFRLATQVNYAVATVFLTPIALVMAEVAPVVHVGALVVDRLLDTLLGAAVAVAVSGLLWRRAAHTRLPTALGRTVRAAGAVLELLVAAEPPDPGRLRQARRRLLGTLLDLTGAYQAAVDEVVRRAEPVAAQWPVLVAVRRMGYLVLASPPGLREGGVDDPAALHPFVARLAAAAEHPPTPGDPAPEPLPTDPPGLSYPPVREELSVIAAALNDRDRLEALSRRPGLADLRRVVRPPRRRRGASGSHRVAADRHHPRAAHPHPKAHRRDHIRGRDQGHGQCRGPSGAASAARDRRR